MSAGICSGRDNCIAETFRESILSCLPFRNRIQNPLRAFSVFGWTPRCRRARGQPARDLDELDEVSADGSDKQRGHRRTPFLAVRIVPRPAAVLRERSRGPGNGGRAVAILVNQYSKKNARVEDDDELELSHEARAGAAVRHADPGVRLRDIADALEITERSAYAIVNDLAVAGYVLKEREGRRNRYVVQRASSAARDSRCTNESIGEVLEVLLVDQASAADAEAARVVACGS